MPPRDYNPIKEDESPDSSSISSIGDILKRSYESGKYVLSTAFRHKGKLGTAALILMAGNIETIKAEDAASAPEDGKVIEQVSPSQKYLKERSREIREEIQRIDDYSAKVIIGSDGESVTASVEDAVKSIDGKLHDTAYVNDVKIYLQQNQRYTWDKEGNDYVVLTAGFVEDEGGLLVAIDKPEEDHAKLFADLEKRTYEALAERKIRTRARYDSLKGDVRDDIIKDETEANKDNVDYTAPHKENMTVLDSLEISRIISRGIIKDSAGAEALDNLNYAGSVTYIEKDSKGSIAVYRYSTKKGANKREAMIELDEKSAEEVKKVLGYCSRFRKFSEEKGKKLSEIADAADKKYEDTPVSESKERNKIFRSAIEELENLKKRYGSSEFSSEKEVEEAVSSIEKKIEEYKHLTERSDFDRIGHYHSIAEVLTEKGELESAKEMNNLALWAAYSYLMANQEDEIAGTKDVDNKSLIDRVIEQNYIIDKGLTKEAREAVEELRKEGRFKAADHLIKKIMDINPGNKEDQRKAGEIKAEIAEQSYSKGKELEKKGDNEGAFESYRIAAELNPEVSRYQKEYGELAKDRADIIAKSIRWKKISDVDYLVEKLKAIPESQSTDTTRERLSGDISRLYLEQASGLISRNKFEKAGQKIAEAKRFDPDADVATLEDGINRNLKASKAAENLEKRAKKEREKLEENKRLFLEGKVRKADRRFRQQQARFSEIEAEFPTFFSQTALAKVQEENQQLYDRFISPVSAEFAEDESGLLKAMGGLGKGAGILIAGEFYDQETGKFSGKNFKKHPARTITSTAIKAAAIGAAVYFNFFYESPAEKDRRLYRENNNSSPSEPGDMQDGLGGSGDGETDTGSPDTPIEDNQDANW